MKRVHNRVDSRKYNKSSAVLANKLKVQHVLFFYFSAIVFVLTQPRRDATMHYRSLGLPLIFCVSSK